MDATCIPSPLPTTVTRSQHLVHAVLTQSLREQGPASRTASAWRWALTGQGPSPISRASCTDEPPSLNEIVAESRHETQPAECGWPPWRYANDPDPDRQQARRVLRWLTGAADAIPLLDVARGRYLGARLHFARTDEDIRRVRGWALHGLREHGDLPEHVPALRAARPWQWPASWMNAAWLRGAVAYFDWVLGDTPTAPLSCQFIPLECASAAAVPPGLHAALISMNGVGCGIAAIEEEIMAHLDIVVMQGHEGQLGAEPDRLPPPQWGEGVKQAHDWVTGENSKPPADHHGCGYYHPCPGLRRCSCEAGGCCLRGQCPACTDHICNAAWTFVGSSQAPARPRGPW